MPAGDERSHGLLTTVVITSLISRKIQGTGIWECFTNSWSCRTQNKQIAGGVFRVIACTDPELVTHSIEGAPLPLAETWELVPPDSSCLHLHKAGRLDSTNLRGTAFSVHSHRNERQNPKCFFLFVGRLQDCRPAASLPLQRPVLGFSQHTSWPQLCQQHAHSMCF